MANELKGAAEVTFIKGNTSIDLGGAFSITITGTRYIKIRQEIGTNEEALDVGDLATLGHCIIINRDSTNFVEIRPATGIQDMLQIKAGNVAMFEFAAGVTAPFAIADTAAVEIEMLIVEI